MMSYEEAAAEIKKRRDECVAKRKSAYKKLTVTICALLVVASAGVGTWMLSRGDETDVPNVPGADTDILLGDPDLSDWFPAPYEEHSHDHSSETDGATVGCCGRPVYANEIIDTNGLCIIDETTVLPETLPVYVTTDRGGINNDDNYAYANEEVKKFAQILYGDEYDESKTGVGYHYLTDDDPYMQPKSSGLVSIFSNVRNISFNLDITRVEEYRDMSYRETLEYVQSMKYYAALVEYLELDEIEVSGNASVNVNGKNTYEYHYTFMPPSADLEDSITKRMDAYFTVKALFKMTADGEGAIVLEFDGFRELTEDSVLFAEWGELEVRPLTEVLEEARGYSYYPLQISEDSDVFVTIEYYKTVNAAWNQPACLVPYYVVYVKLDEPMGGCSYAEDYSACALVGFDEYLDGLYWH